MLRRSMKAQMREANRKGARMAVIVGESELAERHAQVKNLRTGEQHGIGFDALVGELKGMADALATVGAPPPQPVQADRETPISES